MSSIRWFLLLVPVVLCTGCLFNLHQTKVIRENEPRQQVVFESVQAMQVFSERVRDDTRREDTEASNSLTIPFLLSYSHKRVLSEGAFFNDELKMCDGNGDRLITLQEATAYNPAYGAPPSDANQRIADGSSIELKLR